MSKSIVIPTNRGSRITVTLNGVIYTYQAGATATVPDAVADIIERFCADPVSTAKTAGDQLAEIEEAIDALDTRLTALDDETDGAVPALDARVTALEEAGEDTAEDTAEDTSGG